MNILNYFLFLIITFLGAKYLFGGSAEVSHPYDKNYKLRLNGPEMFWVLTFSTGLLALSAPALLDLMALRLLVLEAFCLIGLFVVKNKVIISFPIVLYLCYILWLFIGLSYSPSSDYGVRVIMKYLYPLLVMFFASAVVRNKELFLKAALGARYVALISLVLIVSIKIEMYVLPGVFWYGTARAIHYISICVFSLALFYYGGKVKLNLFIAILFTLPCIIWVFRTSIMGTSLALMTFFFFRYKLKSLPVILGVLTLFVGSIFFIPSVRDKMFNEQGSGKSLADLRSGNISSDDIDSNGRFAMWEWSMKKFYDGKELMGTGTGNLQETFYSLKHPFGTIKICHNDYVQILCDNGLIGVGLFGASFLLLIIHCFIVCQKKQYSWLIHVCAITAGASMAGVLLTLYTDNVINYSMCTISYPCGFYGMMLGLIRGYKQQSTNAIQ